MKKVIIVFVLNCFVIFSALGQTKNEIKDLKNSSTTIPLARVTCSKTTHDFGKIPQGTPVTFSFGFKNEGKKPLLINDVSTPCGCTSPMFDKDKPFDTGSTAPIDITFNAASEGVFEKTVTVTYNGTSTMDLIIKGEVVVKQNAIIPAIIEVNHKD